MEANRFQEYVDDWSYPDKIEAPLYPIDQISKVPVSMFVADQDSVCKPGVAETFSSQFQTLQNYYTLKGAGHNYFGFQAYKADFMDILVKELADVVSSTPNRQELELEMFGRNASQKDSKTDTGGTQIVDIDEDAAMSLVNVGAAVVAGTIAIILQ